MADGTIRIEIEVDGKQVEVASKELDKLEESGMKSGKGIKAAEDSMDGLSDSSSKAGSSVKGAGDAIEGLGDSGSKASKDIKGTEGSVDSLAGSSADASSSVKSAADSLDNLGESGSRAGNDLKSADGAIDGLADSSANAVSGVQGASDGLDNLAGSASDAASDLQGADGSIDSIASTSADAASSVQGAASSLDGLSDSGADVVSNLSGADSSIDSIADSSASAASSVQGASGSLDGMSDSASAAAEAARRASEETEGIGQGSESASIGIKNLAASLGLVAIASVAFNTLKSSLDSAITRFDTLATFPKVLEALGVSAEDAERSMGRLSEGIDGLPTTLNDIAANAQRMYTSFSDMDKATEAALALNNALLGSGSSAAEAQRGTDQYVKALQSGKMDMMMWNTLSQTMDVGLIKIAEGFGYAGKSAKNDLYTALQDGAITMDDFTNKLIEVGTGTGIMAELAKENSLGLATSIGNLKNAAARGIADIIGSFDKLSQEVTGKDIAQNIDSLKHIVNASFKAIGSVIEGTTPVIKMFSAGVKAVLPVVSALSPVLIGMATAFAIHAVISKTTAALKASETVIATVTVLKKAYTLITNRAAAAELLSSISTTVLTASRSALAAITAITTTAQLLMTGQITLGAAAMMISAGAATIFGAALQFMMGPIGWVTLAIGALIGGIMAAVGWFKKSKEEVVEVNEVMEQAADTTKTMTDALDGSADAYKKQVEGIESSTTAHGALAERIEDLAGKEKMSSAEKLLLSQSIEQLNGEVEGLGLSYNAEADALNLSSEQIAARLQLMQDMESSVAGQERLLEISKEQGAVDAQLADLNVLREEARDKLASLDLTSEEFTETMRELNVQEGILLLSTAELAEQFNMTEAEVASAMAGIATSTETSAASQLHAFSQISESNETLVNDLIETWASYEGAATEMFDSLSGKVEKSAAEMTKIMQDNQAVISEWGANIATLMEKNIDQGLIDTFIAKGPESAGEVKALVKASSDELKAFEAAFKEGADVATDVMGITLGEGGPKVAAATAELAEIASSSLREQFASADFESVGLAIPEGLEAGIKDGAPQAEAASKQMADDTAKAAAEALGVQSPSTVFKEFGVNVADGLAIGINEGTAKVIQAIQEMLQSVQDDSEKSFQNIVKTYETSVEGIKKALDKLPVIVKDSMSKSLAALNTGATAQVAVMTALSKNLLTPFNNTPSQFETIGNHAMAGLNRGLNAGKAQVMATARSIASSVASTMSKALDIHSPSRVMRDIGEFTIDGLIGGMDNRKARVENTMKGITQRLIDVTEHAASETKRISKEAAIGIAEIETKANEDILDIRQSASEKKKALTTKEVKKIRDIEAKSAKDRANIAKSSAAEINKINGAIYEERMKAVNDFIKDKKDVEELSLVDEVNVWRRSIHYFKEGTAEKKKAQIEYRNAVEKVYQDLTKISEDYSDRQSEINKKLIEDERELTEAYEEAVIKRADSIRTFASLFELFEEKESVSGQELTNNLTSQVKAMQDWQREIEELARKGIDEGLLGELRDMGPKALAELRGLNSLTDNELTKYSNLYVQKSAIARKQAEKELEGMKADTAKQIEALRKTANNELAKLQSDWIKSIRKLTDGTAGQLKTLNQIGKDAMKGMQDGLQSMAPSLIATARDIANAVSKEIADVLKVRSPSRVMMEIGGFVGQGLINGMKDQLTSVKSMARQMGEAVDIQTSQTGSSGSFENSFRSVAIPVPIGNVMSVHAAVNTSAKKAPGSSAADNQLGELIGAINKLASRPASFQIDGVEVVRAISPEMNRGMASSATSDAYMKGIGFK